MCLPRQFIAILLSTTFFWNGTAQSTPLLRTRTLPAPGSFDSPFRQAAVCAPLTTPGLALAQTSKLTVLSGAIARFRRAIAGPDRPPAANQDPIPSKAEGEKRQLQALSDLPIEEFDRFFFTMGDFDNLSKINDVMTKVLLGTLAAPSSPDLEFVTDLYHSIYRESRETLVQAFAKNGFNIHQYVGGDEFFVESSHQDSAEARRGMAAALAEFTQSLRGRYAIFWISPRPLDGLTREVVLDAAQSGNLRALPGVMGLSHDGERFTLLVDLHALTDAFADATPGESARQFEQRMLRPLIDSHPEQQLERIAYETPNRGLMTAALGSLTARGLLSYILQQTGDPESEWLERRDGARRLRRDRVEEFQIWGMRLANDMLSQAKEHGKNQIFVAPDNPAVFQRFVHPNKPVTKAKILETRELLKHPDAIEAHLSRIPSAIDVRRWAEGRRPRSVSVATLDRYFADSPVERVFHDAQDPASLDYRGGNQLIAADARLMNSLFAGSKTLWQKVLYIVDNFPRSLFWRPQTRIGRNPPDSFLVVSEEALPFSAETLGPRFDDGIARLTAEIDAMPKGRTRAAAPHVTVYAVSDSDLGQHKAIRSTFQTVYMLMVALWACDVLPAVRRSGIAPGLLADVSEDAGGRPLTFVRFNSQKFPLAFEVYRKGKDARARESLKALQEWPDATPAAEPEGPSGIRTLPVMANAAAVGSAFVLAFPSQLVHAANSLFRQATAYVLPRLHKIAVGIIGLAVAFGLIRAVADKAGPRHAAFVGELRSA